MCIRGCLSVLGVSASTPGFDVRLPDLAALHLRVRLDDCPTLIILCDRRMHTVAYKDRDRTPATRAQSPSFRIPFTVQNHPLQTTHASYPPLTCTILAFAVLHPTSRMLLARRRPRTRGKVAQALSGYPQISSTLCCLKQRGLISFDHVVPSEESDSITP